MNSKTITALLLLILGVLTYGVSRQAAQAPSFSGTPVQTDTFGGDGTHASTTVNTTSTQILDGNWSFYARITNGSGTAAWCYTDNATAASSTVNVNSGYIVNPASQPGNVLCFGKVFGCVPYVGKVNCLSAGSAFKLGTFEK